MLVDEWKKSNLKENVCIIKENSVGNVFILSLSICGQLLTVLLWFIYANKSKLMSTANTRTSEINR